MKHAKSTLKHPLLLSIIVLFALIISLSAEVTYAPFSIKAPNGVALASECHSITHLQDINNSYRIGVTSRLSCLDAIGLNSSVLATFFDETYVDFYSFKDADNIEFLFTEVSGRITRTGIIWGFIVLVVLSFCVVGCYRISFSEKKERKIIMLRLLAFVQILLMFALVIFAANATRFKVLDVPSEIVGLSLE
jgi:hypothetical protein